MALEITQREREGITVLEMKGRITLGKESTLLRDKCSELLAAGITNVVFNLEHVDFIDSTGLGALVICATSARNAGGAVKLVHLNRRNIELLVMTRLATAFETFNDEQDAINSFYPDRKIRTFDILDFVQKMKQEE
jgi:anti-sigma B factor antagonist